MGIMIPNSKGCCGPNALINVAVCDQWHEVLATSLAFGEKRGGGWDNITFPGLSFPAHHIHRRTWSLRQTDKVLVWALGLTSWLSDHGWDFFSLFQASVSSFVKWVGWAIGFLTSFPALEVHEYWYMTRKGPYLKGKWPAGRRCVGLCWSASSEALKVPFTQSTHLFTEPIS